MDFDFNDVQQQLRARSRALLEEENPISRVRDLLEDPLGFERDVWRCGAALGWYRMLVPEAYGGESPTSQPLVDLVVVVEELGRLLQPEPVGPQNLAALAISQTGSEAQREEHLPSLLDGDRTATWCLAEPGGWQPQDVATIAEPVADGLRLRGAKRFVPSVAAADLLLVTARIDGDLAQLLVPIDAEGLEVIPRKTIDVTRRWSDVAFHSVIVPEASVLPMSDRRSVEEQLQIALVLQCAESAAGAMALVEMSTSYAKQRIQFGRQIGSFQAIKHKLANMHVAAHSAACAARYAAMAVSDGQPDAEVAVAVAKVFAADAYAWVAGEAVQVHGGRGFTWDIDVHLHMRRAKANQVLLGTSDGHRERLCELIGV